MRPKESERVHHERAGLFTVLRCFISQPSERANERTGSDESKQTGRPSASQMSLMMAISEPSDARPAEAKRATAAAAEKSSSARSCDYHTECYCV